MVPPWMPQNIQKRLLRYVLQQLSLFSEIDLPNLDVSLGTNSKIVLRDVQLDSEKISLPGVFLRDGKVKNLELLLAVGGGVNIDANGLEMTLAPSVNSTATNTKGKFSLAQSTADLANSIMLDKYDDDVVDEDDENTTDTDTENGNNNNNPSRLNAMMVRAAELALARLKVEVHNIDLTIIADAVTLSVHIHHVSFNSADGIRNIKVEGIDVELISPVASPGEVPSTGEPVPESEKEEEEEEEEEDDYDDDDNDMMSSSMMGDRKESLMDSMVFSHEEASSLYMSATSNFLKSSLTEQDSDIATRLLHVNEAEISFQGFQSIEELSVSIDELKMAATPWPTALTGIIAMINRLRKLDNLKKRATTNGGTSTLGGKPVQAPSPNIRIDLGVSITTGASDGDPSDVPNTEDEDEDTSTLLFENFSLNRVTVDLCSALGKNGKFLKNDTLRLVLESVKFAQDDADQFQGFIDSVKVFKAGNCVLQLNQGLGIDEADITFKYEKFKNEHTEAKLVISKPVIGTLDKSSIFDIAKFVNRLEPLLEFLQNTNSSSKSFPNTASMLRSQIDSRRYQHHQTQKPAATTSEPVSKFSFQSESIDITLALSSSVSLQTLILPIHYTNHSNTILLDQIVVDLLINADRHQLLSIENLKYQMFTKDEVVRTFGITSANQFDVSDLFTSSKLTVKSITFRAQFGNLQKLIALGKSLGGEFSAIRGDNLDSKPKNKKKVRLSNTTFFQKSLSTFVSIKNVKLEISDFKENFGGVLLNFENISGNVFKNSPLYHLFALNGTAHRILDGVKQERFFAIAAPEDNRSPIVGIKIRDKSVINVSLRNIVLGYYTQWLAYFENNDPKTSDPVPAAPSSDVTQLLEVKNTLQDCVIELNPGRLAARALVVVRKGNLDLNFAQTISIKSTLKNLTLLLIDDVANVLSDADTKDLRQWSNIRGNTTNAPSWSQISNFILKGYVSVASVNAIHSNIVFNNEADLQKWLNDKTIRNSSSKKSICDMKINTETWNIDLCADSAQCLIQLLNDLKQPFNISFEDKYKPDAQSSAVNIFDEIEEFAFGRSSSQASSNGVSVEAANSASSLVDSYYGSVKSNSKDVSDSAAKTDSEYLADSSELANTIQFNDRHFDSQSLETLNQRKKPVDIFPVSIFFGASKIVVNLYDGYDWKETRNTIAGVIKRVQAKAAEVANDLKDSKASSRAPSSDPPSRGSTKRRDSFGDMGFMPDFDNEEYMRSNNRMVGETLYDSIILSVPVGSDISSMTDNINRGLGVNESDSALESSTSKSLTKVDSSDGNANIDLGEHMGKKLRLKRSKYQKVSVELQEVEFEMIVFTTFDPSKDPPRPKDSAKESEVVNSMEIRVREFFIIDNVPTSTWNRFATYMTEAGIREIGVSMFQIKIETVRPVSSLAATELILDVHVLPLNLHVDQDTLDFLARFGEFKDNRFLLVDPYEDIIYIQKFTVNAVKIKLDYKPKKVDYNGIRSGHTSEFMNFFILDEAEIVLKSVSLHGISGFPRLNKMLNDCWMPDIKSTQLSGVLAGLAPVRSIVKIGSGFKDLVAVPVKEYKKDGRVVRSLQQGVFVFAKTTSNELLKFGVKLAAGTQTALENAEGALGGEGSSGRLSSFRREQAMAALAEEEHLYAITDLKTLKKSKDKHGMEASLIGRGAIKDTIEPLSSRHGYPSQTTLDSFADVYDSDDELPPAMANLKTSSGRPFLIDDDDDDDNDKTLSTRESMDDDERQRFVSLYADQPHNMKEGLQAAYTSLGRNFSTAREALADAGSSVSESNSAKAAAYAIAKATPVAVMRPIIGTTEAISKALLGGMNQLDPSQRAKSEEKYKSTR